MSLFVMAPAQSLRGVYGLRDYDAGLFATLERADAALSSMDAPNYLPCGSMRSMVMFDGTHVVLERSVRRDCHV